MGRVQQRNVREPFLRRVAVPVLGPVLGPVFGLMLAAMLTCSAMAGEVTVSVDASKGVTTVDADNAKVDDVLAKVGEALGFTIERAGQHAAVGTVSGHFEGPLDVVLQRILRGEGHMIERSAKAKSGVVRIVLFGSTGGGGVLAQRQGRHKPTQAQTGEEDEAALLEAQEQEAAEQEAAVQAQQAQQLRRMRKQPPAAAASQRRRGQVN